MKWAKEARQRMEEELKKETEEINEEVKDAAEDTEETTEEVLEGEVVEEAAEEENPADKALAEAQEKYKRLFAEFDNFRKRTEREKSMRYDMGARDMVEKILPVLDTFELALKNVPEAEQGSSFVDGMEKIHKQFLTVLENAGVKAIEAVGKEFDPNFHNAVMHVEDETVGDNIVVEELQKGYTYKDSIVRYSMVKVAN
ncbi:MAG: nucleotide exchange factor GrpE [Lachnospiraceae bacterium]|nr:nucleotide exchange factor GrpE [Lachnospiraceae bacterium]